MKIRRRLATATVGVLSLVGAATTLAPAPAMATSHDCTIMGPDYVREVVDCAVYVIERAINW